jgi:hypothetical protein
VRPSSSGGLNSSNTDHYAANSTKGPKMSSIAENNIISQ